MDVTDPSDSPRTEDDANGRDFSPLVRWLEDNWARIASGEDPPTT